MSVALQKDYSSAATAAMTSTEEIRQRFPALARTHNGYSIAYFDGPGGTQVPRTVVEAMNDYLYHHNANTHWAYPTSEETDAIIDSARNVLADFLNASPTEIVFGANMTTLTFHLARALSRGYGPDDEIVVTELDHHANIAPWRTLEKECGLKVRMVKMIRETGELDWDDFSRQLTRQTKLVALGAASNALGTINDVKRAGEMAHSLGAKVFVDAVHYAPHELIDAGARLRARTGGDWNSKPRRNCGRGRRGGFSRLARSRPHSARKVGCCVRAASRTRRCVNHTTVEWLGGNRACAPLRAVTWRITHADDCVHR